METRKTFCRFCHANCAIEVDIDHGRAVAVRPDLDDPIYGGYTCEKGRELAAVHNHPQRLLSTQKRGPDGSFTPIASARALDEIAARLATILERHGPRAIASYCGTYASQNSAVNPVAAGFHKGLGSTSFYTSMTIDQPAKIYTWSRVGAWLGGPQGFSDADVWMLIGNNPITSHACHPGSMVPINPSRRIRDAKKRGMTLICIDPRVSLVARLADIHLQVRPGEDATLLAGMLKVILDERLHDEDFCARHVDADGLAELHRSLEGFTPGYVAHRADVRVEDMIAAARAFARGPRGLATSGTGPEMALRGTLTEHFVIALNTVCGRFCREGEQMASTRVFSPPPMAPKAQVLPPQPLWGDAFPQSRVRGLSQLGGYEMPTTTLADEILTPGEGQVRALLCIGGNPVVAWPNQRKAARAMRALDLLVSVDIKLSQTARLAHYVVAPQLSFERDDISSLGEWWYEQPYARYTEALLPPPGDLIDEWEFYWGLAERLGTRIELAGGALPTGRKPDKFEVLEAIASGSRVPLARIRAETREGGRLYPEAPLRVAPADPGADGRFQLAPAGVPEEIRAMRAEALDARGGRAEPGWDATHLLISRRTRQFFNSAGQDIEALRAKGITNHAHMHPSELRALGIEDDAIVEIETPTARIHGVVRGSEELKPGVISMAHCFGDIDADQATVRREGSTTNRLVSDERDFDPITGQCRQSAIPVRIRPIPAV